jgi:hypothetical protein
MVPDWDLECSDPSCGKDSHSLSEQKDDELLMDEYGTAKTSCSLHVELQKENIKMNILECF